MEIEQIGLEVFLLFILIFVNGLFSMSEIAIVTARKFRLGQRAAAGDLGAKAALKIAASPDRFLSTVQIGITLVGVLSGAFGGAALAVHLAPLIEDIPALAPYAQQLSFGIVVLLITYFSLVLGELIPKRIGLIAPEKIAARISRPMNLVSKIMAPVVWILSTSTGAILRIFRLSKNADESVTEDEIKALIAQGATSGVFEDTEQELMESVIRLDDQNITALMTPRTKIRWINLQDSKDEIRQHIKDSQFSRLLVCESDLDSIRGFVKSKDLLNLFLTDRPLNIPTVTKEPIFIPETSTALQVLEKFREANTHIAVIIDEFGSTHGIVTTNDILEAIVGNLPFGGIRNNTVVQRDDGAWVLDARLSVTEFREILDLGNLPADELGMYETLAGFVIKRLEKLPRKGDKFEWRGYSFEVIDMDGKRISSVLVSFDAENQ